MVLTNYKKPNYYKELIQNFTDGNKHMSFGVTKSFSTIKYRWVADYLFKHRNNIHTNKHKVFISFFSNKDMALSEYGNILEMQESFPNYFDGISKSKIPEFSYELSSGQYARIGIEHTEFDDIDYIDASDRLFSNDDSSSSYNIVLGTLINQETQTLSGSVNVVNGSTQVTWSSGNQFNSFNTPSGTKIIIGDDIYEVSSVTSPTVIMLTDPYVGSSEIKPYQTFTSEKKRVISTNHIYSDAPVFISMGYKFHDFTTDHDRFIWSNPPESVSINFNNFIVSLNDDPTDVYASDHFKYYIENNSIALTSGNVLPLIGAGSLVAEQSVSVGLGIYT